MTGLKISYPMWARLLLLSMLFDPAAPVYGASPNDLPLSGLPTVTAATPSYAEASPSPGKTVIKAVQKASAAARSSEEEIELSPTVTDPNYKFILRDSPDGSEIWIDVTDWYTSADISYNSTSYRHKECSSAFMLLFNDQKIKSIGKTIFKGKYSYYSSTGNSEVTGQFKRTVNFNMGSSSTSGKKNTAELYSRDGGNFTLYHMYMVGSGMYNVAFVDCPGDYWDGNHQKTVEHPRTSDSCTFYAGPADTSEAEKYTLKWTVDPIADDDLTNERPMTRNCFRIKIAKKQLTDSGLRLTGIKPISFFGDDGEVIEIENNSVVKEVIYTVKAVSASSAAPVLYTSSKKAKEGTEITETPRAVTGYNTPSALKFKASEGYTALFKYTPVEYRINYSGIEEISSGNPNPQSYTVEDEIKLLPVTRDDGFNFTGWYDEKNVRVIKLSKGSTGEKNLTAHWSADIKDNDDGSYTFNSGRYKGRRFTYGADGIAGSDDDHEVAIGADGAWGTEDDCYILNTDGRHAVFKGRDNRFVTPESDADDYYDNSRYSPFTYVKPGKNKYFQMDEKAPEKAEKDDELWWSGPDGVIGSDDDMIIKDHKINTEGNLYVSAGSHIDYDDKSSLKPGRDLIFGTEDDLLIKKDVNGDPYIENDTGTISRPGSDGEFGTEDDEIFYPGKDRIPGTEDDSKVYPGDDGKYGTDDDYYIDEGGNKVYPGDDNVFGSEDDLMQKGDELISPGPDKEFGTEDDIKIEKPEDKEELPSDDEENSLGNESGENNTENPGDGTGNSGEGSQGSGPSDSDPEDPEDAGSDSKGDASSGSSGSSGSHSGGHSGAGSSGSRPHTGNNTYVDSGPGAQSPESASDTGIVNDSLSDSSETVSDGESGKNVNTEASAAESGENILSVSGSDIEAVDPENTSDISVSKGLKNPGSKTGFSSEDVIEKVFDRDIREKEKKKVSEENKDDSEKLPSIPKTGDSREIVAVFSLFLFLSSFTCVLICLKFFHKERKKLRKY